MSQFTTKPTTVDDLLKGPHTPSVLHRDPSNIIELMGIIFVQIDRDKPICATADDGSVYQINPPDTAKQVRELLIRYNRQHMMWANWSPGDPPAKIAVRT